MTKWLKRICLGILLLFILLFAFVFLRSVIPVTVQDRELQLERANIPAGQNAFDTLQTAATNIWWPEEKKEVIFDLVSNTNWNDSLAATVLKTISARDREILTRFYLQEQSQEQICQEMSLTETQFRLLKSRAKAKFGELGKRRLERKQAGLFQENFL